MTEVERIAKGLSEAWANPLQNGVNCPACGARLPSDYSKPCPDCTHKPPRFEKTTEAIRLRAVICAIIDARDDENFDALMSAINDARTEVVIGAMQEGNHPCL